MNEQDWSYPYELFDVYGIELEYMIVDRSTLDVRPVCDALFQAATGSDVSEVTPDGESGIVSWSNELALHVVELKAAKPVATLDGLAEHFQKNVVCVNTLLEPFGCRLLPGGMHPWMDPSRETELWPHEYNDIYKTYDRIFNCNGHGWSNLQSTHINLPFANDEQFGRLHAAIRLLLSVLPALAASSPIVDGKATGIADYRLEVYRTNAARIPMMTGLVIPEAVFTREVYDREILGRLYAELAPFDPQGVLFEEFANARGAIARFDRGAIEIRVLDIQECPQADIALAALIVEVLRALVSERWMSYEDQKLVATEMLHGVFVDTIFSAENCQLGERALLKAFGISRPTLSAGELWLKLLDDVLPSHPVWTPLLRRVLNAGSLATRIARALPSAPGRADLVQVYGELADCLRDGRLFRA
ncbi:MAG: carboxylate-amine ligase [Gammaproteobacteria bacterium]|jgi:carboxylate-amine ligase